MNKYFICLAVAGYILWLLGIIWHFDSIVGNWGVTIMLCSGFMLLCWYLFKKQDK